MSENSIILYPSNWLYNSGVIGLLMVRERASEPVGQDLLPDGSCRIPENYFAPLSINNKPIPKAIVNLVNALVSDDDLSSWLDDTNRIKYQEFFSILGQFGYKFIRAGNRLFASKMPYQNLVQFSEWQSFEYAELVGKIPELLKVNSGNLCNLCAQYPVFILDPNSKLQQRLCKLQSSHLKNLGPSLGEFPNGFWGLNESMGICYLCSFLLIHHHFALTRLSDGSQIFINAPSFRLMHHLNRFAQNVFGVLSSEESRNKRNILAISLIEYVTKIQATLGIWTGMNIEIITRQDDQVDFFSLPYEIIKLISDRPIASLLSQIGEFGILNYVLDKNFSQLMEIGYRLLRIGLKPKGTHGKSDSDFINQTLHLNKNRSNPRYVAEQIFQLCALIEEKKRRETHEYISTSRN